MTTSASNPEDALDDPNGDNAEGDGDEDEDDWSDTSSMLHDLLQDEDDVKTQIRELPKHCLRLPTNQPN